MASVAEQIRAKNEEFMTAFHKKDAEGIAALYTSQARLMPPGSELLEGKSKIQGFWDGVLRAGMTDASLETIDVDLLGGYTAVETGKFTMKASGAVADRGKYLVVWRNEEGTWKLHRDVWNSSEKR
jgi:uncharacterized protein (TIGR02246 family)